MRLVLVAVGWAGASLTPGVAAAQVSESDKRRLEPIMRVWAYEGSPVPRIAVTRDADGRLRGWTLERATVCGRRARMGTIVWRDLRRVDLTVGERREGKIAKYEGTVCNDTRRWGWILWRNADGSLRGGDAESGTGISHFFVEPPPGDADGDALPDADEVIGADLDDNGTVDVDLPSMGADHLQKDLFVEVDSMPGRRLSDGAIGEVVQAFRRAPVPNPGGLQGVALHVDNGRSSMMDHVRRRRWGSFSAADTLGWRRYLSSSGDPWRAFDAVKRDHFHRDRASYFQYAVSIHEIEPLPDTRELTGEARAIGVSDFIVSLGAACPGRRRGCPSTRELQAATFMHELGHTLGLRHGGFDDINLKPNHLSMMNDFFGYTGLLAPSGPVFDFTGPDEVSTLDERGINETAGIAGPASRASFNTLRFCPGTAPPARPLQTQFNQPRDLDCDGTIENALVAASMNGDDAEELLEVGSEWGALRFTAGANATVASQNAERIREATVGELLRYSTALLGDRGRPALRMRLDRRAARRIVHVTATDDRGLDQILVRIDKRTYRTPSSRSGRRRLATSIRVPARARRVSAIALDRSGRYSETRAIKLRRR